MQCGVGGVAKGRGRKTVLKNVTVKMEDNIWSGPGRIQSGPVRRGIVVVQEVS